jgi:thiosulfate/3-mercaptopyruvate sulfurtransferase
MLVVDAPWLAEHLSDVVVVDVRWYTDGRVGREVYEVGHIPGAVFADLDADLAGAPAPGAGRHPLPEPADFSAVLEALEIGDHSHVVAYDDRGGLVASRLVWMLRVTGRNASVLDGGLDAWTGADADGEGAAPRDLEVGAVARPPTRVEVRPWPAEALASLDQVRHASASAASPAVTLIDARAADRFAGRSEPLDPVAGHIPGGRSVPCSENLDPTTGRFRSPEELSARFAAAGLSPDDDIVAYCGSGVTACHNLIALDLAGYRNTRLFPGSWSQWCTTEPALPVATGLD